MTEVDPIPQPADDDPLIGITELVDLAEVKRTTVHAWRHRGVLPPEDPESLPQHPMWRKSVLINWLRATDRLPELRRKRAEQLAG